MLYLLLLVWSLEHPQRTKSVFDRKDKFLNMQVNIYDYVLEIVSAFTVDLEQLGVAHGHSVRSRVSQANQLPIPRNSTPSPPFLLDE